MVPFVAAALPLLTQAAPALIRLFGISEQSEKNAKAAEIVGELAKQVTGETTLEGATIKIQADADAASKFNAAVQENWYELVESGVGGIAGARKANESYLATGAQPFWMAPVFWISSVLFIMVFMLLTDMFYVHPDSYDGNLRTQVVTAVLMIIGIVSSYWLGTSASSVRKTELIGK